MWSLMSLETSRESFMQPSQEVALTGRGGTTSATGFPNRVIRTGAPVRRTSSRTPKHVALNLEIAISRIIKIYHGQRLWSKVLLALTGMESSSHNAIV